MRYSSYQMYLVYILIEGFDSTVYLYEVELVFVGALNH